jgi:hypothetical protein
MMTISVKKKREKLHTSVCSPKKLKKLFYPAHIACVWGCVYLVISQLLETFECVQHLGFQVTQIHLKKRV